jgi:hypothetical protein
MEGECGSCVLNGAPVAWFYIYDHTLCKMAREICVVKWFKPQFLGAITCDHNREHALFIQTVSTISMASPFCICVRSYDPHVPES